MKTNTACFHLYKVPRTGNVYSSIHRVGKYTGRNYAAQVAIVKEMTGRNRAAKLEIVKQMSRQ